jgi:hypothetical protein
MALSSDAPAASDVAVDAADPAPTSQPYLVARLDIAAVLPLSSTFFQQKSLAVAAGLPSTKADDLVTDKALTEQGLSQRQLAAKWGPQDLELLGLTGSSAEGADTDQPDGMSAIAGAAAAASASAGGGTGGLAGGCTDAGSLGAAVAGGLMEAGDDETAGDLL